MNEWFEAEQRVERAQRLTESQRFEEALAEIDGAISINPNNATWHAQRGYVLEELDRPEIAAEAYTRSLEIESDDREVSIALGLVLSRLGRHTQALEILDQVALNHPEFEPAYCYRIAIYTELGRHDQAEEMFYLAQGIDDECPHCFFNIGTSLLARGETKRAIFCWHRVLQLEPEYVGVNRRIAQAYRKKGELKRAREYFLEELRDDPGNTDLMFELADMMLEAGQVSAAMAKLTQIIELEPESTEARFTLGQIWLRKGNAEKAIECFQEVIAYSDINPLPIGFDRVMGLAYFQAGRWDDALEPLQKASEQDEANVNVLMTLGHCLLAVKKCAEAADWYRRALAHDAENALAHHNLGLCLFKCGKFEAGLAQYEEAIRFKPDFAMAMHNATLGYIQLGQWGKAREMIDRALKHDPVNAPIRRLSRQMWRYRLRRFAQSVIRPFTKLFKRPIH